MKKILISFLLLVSSVSIFGWNNWEYSGRLLSNVSATDNSYNLYAYCYGDLELFHSEGFLFEDDSTYKDVKLQNVEVSFSDLSRRNVVWAFGEWFDDSLVLQKSDVSLWVIEKMLENDIMFLKIRMLNGVEKNLVFWVKNFSVNKCEEA